MKPAASIHNPGPPFSFGAKPVDKTNSNSISAAVSSSSNSNNNSNSNSNSNSSAAGGGSALTSSSKSSRPVTGGGSTVNVGYKDDMCSLDLSKGYIHYDLDYPSQYVDIDNGQENQLDRDKFIDINLSAPIINACLVVIITFGENNSNTILLHLDPSQIKDYEGGQMKPEPFDKLFQYLKDKGVSNIIYYFSIRSGDNLSYPDTHRFFLDRAAVHNITLDSSPNTTPLHDVMRNTDLELTGNLDFNVTREAFSYHLCFFPKEGLLICCCDRYYYSETKTYYSGLFICPTFFSKENIIQIPTNNQMNFWSFYEFRAELFSRLLREYTRQMSEVGGRKTKRAQRQRRTLKQRNKKSVTKKRRQRKTRRVTKRRL